MVGKSDPSAPKGRRVVKSFWGNMDIMPQGVSPNQDHNLLGICFATNFFRPYGLPV